MCPDPCLPLPLPSPTSATVASWLRLAIKRLFRSARGRFITVEKSERGRKEGEEAEASSSRGAPFPKRGSARRKTSQFRSGSSATKNRLTLQNPASRTRRRPSQEQIIDRVEWEALMRKQGSLRSRTETIVAVRVRQRGERSPPLRPKLQLFGTTR